MKRNPHRGPEKILWRRLIVAAAICTIGSATAGSRALTRGDQINRPDVSAWPTIGTTIRTDGSSSATPMQFRQVQLDPHSLRTLLARGVFPDGARFAVRFYGVALDHSQRPSLYHATEESALAIEIIDRRHPDGRRFYVFTAPSMSATALPPGNECAACHRRDGRFDGTFAHLYPVIRNHVRS